MRPVLAAAVLAAGFAAAASPFTAYFNALDTELQARRDGDFGGTLDRVQKKQQKAVLKCLDLLARPADDLGDDLKTAGAAAKFLEKAYGTEFAEGLSVAAVPLPGILDTLLDDLGSEVNGAVGALAARLISVTPKAAVKVGKAVDAAYAALALPYADRAGRAKNLQKAWKQVVKGNRAADKGAGSPGGESMTFMVGATPYTAVPHADLFATGDGIQVSGIHLPAAGGLVTVSAAVAGVTGPGEYPIQGPGAAGAYSVFDPLFSEQDWFLVPDTGTLVITAFDPGGTGITGSFSFEASGPSTVVITAQFTIVGSIDVNAGALP